MLITRRGLLFGSAAALPLGATDEPQPKLVVLIAAEQFRPDYLDRYVHLMGAGGFRRLMQEGSYFPDCRHLASTFTSTGLATIATGCWPDAHGIVADTWFDPAAKQVVTASAATLAATTLADSVSSADPKNQTIATSMEPSRPEMLVGTARRKLLTSDSPASAAPGDPMWYAAFLEAHPPKAMLHSKWMPLRGKEGAPPLRVLVDEASRRSSPLAQEQQFQLLRALIAEERLGMGETVDLVAAVLGSIGLLGYETGADSPLMRDLVLHMDRQIELTLDALLKAPGEGKFVLAFTAAHGAPPEPLPERRPQLGVRSEDVAKSIDAALSSSYDVSTVKNRYVERYIYPFLYLRHAQLRRYGINLREARRAAGEAALRIPGVAAYYTADGECSRGGEWVARFRNSFHALRSGDVMLSYAPNAVEESAAKRGVSYGSLYSYDAHVPLLLYGGPFRAQTFDAAVEAVDIAPTLARAARVAPPSSSIGRVLAEAFGERPKPKK